MSRMTTRVLREKATQIIKLVQDLREETNAKWPTPNHSESMLWAISELGEFAEVEVVNLKQWVRNNAPKKYDPPNRELAQFIIMCATSAYQTRTYQESGYRPMQLILSILLDTDYQTKINLPLELIVRTIKYAEQFYPDIDIKQEVIDECNRIRAKFIV